MASNPQHEPTMEEILASIRKIISEDSSEAQPAQEARSTNGSAAPSAASIESDVYELREAEIVEEPQPAPALQPAVVPLTPEPARVMQMPVAPKTENDIVFQPREESPVTVSVSPAPVEPHSETHEGFFSDTTRKAMHETFARLDPAQDETPAEILMPSFSSAGASVQEVFEHAIRDSFGPLATQYLHGNIDVIVDRMKPLVREWMDEHFPAILEGAVRNEVERAVKAAASTKARR
jgi:cell pole-organizing protein PopZ